MHASRLVMFVGVSLALTGCGQEVTQGDGAAFVAHVREWIPSAGAYDETNLVEMAENVCRVGSVDDGVAVLDNYSQLDPTEYRAFAISALEYACPGAGED